MEGKEAIISKILEEARLKADNLVKGAQDETAEVEANARREEDKRLVEMRGELNAECHRMIDRRLTLARLEARKTALEYKQRAVSEAYELAEKKLLSDVKLYAGVMAKLVAAAAEEGDALVLGKEDSALDAKWFSSLGLGGKVTLSKEKHDGRGAILRGRASDKTLTVASIMADLRSRTESDVAAMLFGGADEGK